MTKFDPTKVNEYSITELAGMIVRNYASLEEIFQIGLAPPKRLILQHIVEDKKDWMYTQRIHTLEAFQQYLSKYDKYPPEYRGEYVDCAKAVIDKILQDEKDWMYAQRIDIIRVYQQYLSKYDKYPPEYRGMYVDFAIRILNMLMWEWHILRKELFQTMREKPWLFSPYMLRNLFDGVGDLNEICNLRHKDDIVSRYLATGESISYEELIQEGIISPQTSEKALISRNYFNFPQPDFEVFGEFPTDDRTEVYFLGGPVSGKTTMLSGILSSMQQNEQWIYQPQWNNEGNDIASHLYYGLIESSEKGIFPPPSCNIAYIKLDKICNKHNYPMIFIDISGGDFDHIIRNIRRPQNSIWEYFNAGSLTKSRNKKLLLITVDYSLCQKEICNIPHFFDECKQKQFLADTLRILSSDGINGTYKDCTLCKFDTLAVIVTKSDLMDCNPNDRAQCALDYLYTELGCFIRHLEHICCKFGINKRNGYKPYIMPFSIGKLQVGNTYVYDPTDSDNLVNFIAQNTRRLNPSWPWPFSLFQSRRPKHKK
ncbi:MAG: hypothetical protein LIP09_05395 [Bacteroidales bacterium]|nr:hypothetical protein [Bacteroidales bacterium]